MMFHHLISRNFRPLLLLLAAETLGTNGVCAPAPANPATIPAGTSAKTVVSQPTVYDATLTAPKGSRLIARLYDGARWSSPSNLRCGE